MIYTVYKNNEELIIEEPIFTELMRPFHFYDVNTNEVCDTDGFDGYLNFLEEAWLRNAPLSPEEECLIS